jgi:hypothetical protein
MEIKDQSHNDFLNFQVQRNMINSAKDCLVILEDLKADNILSEEYYIRLRAKILSSVNDRIRDMKAIIDQFTVELRKH